MGLTGMHWLLGVICGATGGVLAGLFGIGGGIVIVPMLALVLNLNQHQAQGVTLAASLLPTGLPAVLHYRKQGVPIHWRLVGSMATGFILGILVGAGTANVLPQNPLRWLFAGFLLLLALRSLWPSRSSETLQSARDLDLHYPIKAALTGFAGGLASGLLGIGGGVILIPILVGVFKMEQREAQLQSLALLLPPLGLPGVLIYRAAQSGMDWGLLGCVALGFACGAYLGARLVMRLNGPMLGKAFSAWLILSAVLLLWH